MRQAFQQLPLERAAQYSLALTVVLFVLGSSSVTQVAGPGRELRWAGLVALAVVALVWAAARGPVDMPRWPLAGMGILGAVALASASWSVQPRVSLERGASFVILLVTASALGCAVAGRTASVQRLLDAVLAAATAVAVAGVGLWIVSSHTAVAGAELGIPARFRGLGENPNTVPMLFAVALPIATLLLLQGAAWQRRAVGAAAFVALEGSIVASGSRGALIGALGGVLLVAVVTATTWWRRFATVAAVAALFLASIVIMQIPKPLAPTPASAPPVTGPSAASAKPPRYFDAQQLLRLEDDIGHPGHGRTTAVHKRRFFGTSGRVEAWRGAIGQALQRPLAGYGFGTESHVFVDRYFTFEGGLPENAYIGIFLQVGLVGLAVFLLVIVTIVHAVWRLRPRVPSAARSVAAAATGMLAAGLLLAVGQSYIYSVGNVATLSVWIGAMLAVAAVATPRDSA